MSQLYASRWDNSYSSPVKKENLQDIADLGIRWALPGGVQRIELLIRAKSRADAKDRYNRHHGDRIIVYDNFIDRPVVSGQIYEVIPDGRDVFYIMAGAWKRHFDQYYTIGNMADLTLPTDDTDVVIKDILDDTVTILGTDQSNIAATSLNIGGWHADDIVGTPAGEAIATLASIGDSSSTPLDYYVIERPFLGGKPQAPLPVLEARSKTSAVDWLVAQEDFAGRGLQQSRHIWRMVNDVRIGYGVLTGTYTAGGPSTTTLTDSAATFIASGVKVGDIVTNISDGSAGAVASVNTATQLTVEALAGGSGNNFVNGDVYGLRLDRIQWISSTTSSKDDVARDFWTVEYREQQSDMDATQALKYATALLDLFDTPVQQQAIVISAPTIRDRQGVRWPLWRVIAHNGGYIRLFDFEPAVVSSAFKSANRKTSMKISAMDYTYKDNQLRIVPDLPDSRLDAIMQQAGLIAGQLISSVPDLPPSSTFSTSDQGQRSNPYRAKTQPGRLIPTWGVSSFGADSGPIIIPVKHGHH
jgi:hypothetical protein